MLICTVAAPLCSDFVAGDSKQQKGQKLGRALATGNAALLPTTPADSLELAVEIGDRMSPSTLS